MTEVLTGGVGDKWEREKEKSVKYQPVKKTKERVNGPRAHKKASAGGRGHKAEKQPVYPSYL